MFVKSALLLCPYALSGVLGCSGGAPRLPNPTRPLGEARAIEVIARAIRAEGAKPAPGRDVLLARNGKTLHIDVGVAGHEYGIAYITAEDAEALGDAIGPANKKDERLRVELCGPDGETRVVLLYQENYVYDDLAGEAHEQTAITCERSLARDVQDFITYVRSKKYR